IPPGVPSACSCATCLLARMTASPPKRVNDHPSHPKRPSRRGRAGAVMLASYPRRSVLALLIASAVAAPASAAPRDELLRFVPDDVGFCLVVQDLRKHPADALGSPFAQAFTQAPLAGKLAVAAEWKQLGDVEKYLKQHLGVGWKEVRDDL